MSSVPADGAHASDSLARVACLTDEATAAICMLAGSLGLDCVRIDLAGCTSKGDLLERVS